MSNLIILILLLVWILMSCTSEKYPAKFYLVYRDYSYYQEILIHDHFTTMNGEAYVVVYTNGDKQEFWNDHRGRISFKRIKDIK